MLGIIQPLLPIPWGSNSPFSGRAVVIWASCPGDKCMLLVGFGLGRSSAWICRQEGFCVLITANRPTEEPKLAGRKACLAELSSNILEARREAQTCLWASSPTVQHFACNKCTDPGLMISTLRFSPILLFLKTFPSIPRAQSIKLISLNKQ